MDIPLSRLRACDKNDQLYRRPSLDDADFVALIESTRAHGQLTPATITSDNMIVSGHRRFYAARHLGLATLKCIRIDKHSSEITPADLAQYNQQREKTCAELIREGVALADPERAYDVLLEDRETRRQRYDELPQIDIQGTKRRWGFSEAQTQPLVDVVKAFVWEQEDYWPLSDRYIHYRIVKIPDLKRNYGKRQLPYLNDQKSYKRLCDILVRMRLANVIPMRSIADETRPVVTWQAYKHVKEFTTNQLNEFLAGYSRDLLQSQTDHIEIIGEKMTIEGAIRPVASRFGIQYTLGRGYSSLPPRRDIAARYRRSRGDALILLFATDFDPEGEDIAHSFARSMRDDFAIREIRPIKVCLTHEQVVEHDLPPRLIAKEKGSRRKGFVEKYGENVHEIDALDPDVIQEILTDSIESVLDMDAYNREVELEKRDAAYLETVRKVLNEQLPKMIPNPDETASE